MDKLDSYEEDEKVEYEYIRSKSIQDSDGFMTDYTMYRQKGTDKYVFVYGDNDVYSAENGNFDYECEGETHANEWFNSYGEEEEIEKEKKAEKRILIAVIGIAFFLLLLCFIVYDAYKNIGKVVPDSVEYSFALSKASETIREGKVVDKIINNSRPISGYKSIEYIIVVENNCEYEGENYVGTKEFMVSEDVYNSYRMGDWFDSRDLTAQTVSKENKDSEVKE